MSLPYHIIVADDDELTRMLLQAVFIRFFPNAQVMTAKNGREALAMYLVRGADLIVTDERMPEMTGTDLVQTLRQRKVEVPIILVSGSPVEHMKDHDYSITNKPVVIAELAQLAKQLLYAA